jgi:hypothetical protein
MAFYSVFYRDETLVLDAYISDPARCPGSINDGRLFY